MALTAWDKTRVYGTWYSQDGERLAGTYQVNMPVRVTIEDGEAIVPAGVYASGDLNTLVAGSPALDVMVPANDDADVTPLGWQISVTVTLTLPSGAKVTENYVIDTPVGGEVNLRTIPLAQTIPPTQTMLLRGVAGGVAALDSDGDVIDADGNKITGGGEGGGQGPKGDKGDKGDPGVDGLSAYEVAVDNGFEGTEGEWLESLVGPTGADGQDGAPGADGSDGAQGEPGEKGEKGDKGDTGDTGPAGPTAVSTDADNTATLGTDDLIYVPPTDLTGLVTSEGLSIALAGKADTSHTHTIANVTGLQSALDGKQAAGSYAAATHNHNASAINAGTLDAARIPTLAQSKVTNLTTDLAAKADATHTHDDRYYTEAEIDTTLGGLASTAMVYHDGSDWIDQDGDPITTRPNAKRVLAFGDDTQPAWLINGDIWVEDTGA